MSALRLGELCAGYGGLGMAVEEVFGATTAWFSEYDAAPSKILAHHWPTVPNYGDMTKIKWSPDCPDCGNRTSVYRRRLTDNSPFYWCSACRKEWDVAIRHADPEAHLIPEPVDIISGGTPCQDLSAAGRRAGMNEGTRSNLWVQMREAVAIQRPRYVVWENVRGAFSAEASSSVEQCPGCVGDTGDGRIFLRALGRVLGDLSDLGYDCQWRGLRAADVGACHGRFRVFVLAANRDHTGRGEQRRTITVRPEHAATEHAGPDATQDADLTARGEWRESAPGQAQGGRTRANAGGRDRTPTAPGNGYVSNSTPWWAEGATPTADTVRGGSGGRAAQPEQAGGNHAALGSDQGATAADAESLGWGEGWTESEGIIRGSDSALSIGTNWGEYGPAILRWERTLGRPAPRPTEPTGRNNGHRLSPAFTEWMMGLPDGWVTDPAIRISRNEQLKACGNGVVPQQAMAALRDMLAAFQEAEAAA